MAGIAALFELIGLIGSAIGWLFGRRPEEDAASSPTEKLGIRYRELAEGRPPSGVGCLVAAWLPWLAILGIVAAFVVGGATDALMGFPSDPPGWIVVVGLAIALGIMFAGSVVLIRNARGPGRFSPVLVLTLAIVLDLGLIVLFVVGAKPS